jgi:DNA-directed RNA polymerase specialized sigma24 family protein
LRINTPYSYYWEAMEIISTHYITGFSLKEIGGAFGIPERQVSRLRSKALQRIGGMPRNKGIAAMCAV